jgi:SsrA-binding protein
MTSPQEAVKEISRNRQAFHLYDILERWEAGIALLGPEVKSVREGKIQLKDAYASIEGGQLWLFHCHVSPYKFHTHEALTPIDPLRRRKLLMHRKEIDKLKGRVEEKGLTLVPLRVYLKRGKVKVEVGLGKGRKLYDKREAIKKREMEREEAQAKGRRS